MAKKQITGTVSFITKTKEEVGVILAIELAKLVKQGRIKIEDCFESKES